MDHKAVVGGIRQVKATGTGWEVAGYASTFGPPPDAVGDIIARGAFAKSIQERRTKLLYEHSEIIGAQLELREDDHGLFGKWFISKTSRGQDVHQLLLDGVLDSLSIGFIATAAQQQNDSTRLLTEVSLFEVSVVSVPANERALITAAKTRQVHRPRDLRLEVRRRRLLRHGIAVQGATLHEQVAAARVRLRRLGVVV